ncbi:MAG TPA: YceI family protein [Flavisolibacter sp.]|nr:YceI family protein [Flavisolibacter sp.]
MANTKWALDPTHSELEFKVKHLMITTVTGQFQKFNGSVETDGDDFTTARVQFSADIDSISTNNLQRDQHLKNGDFFDAENHPTLDFVSSRLEKTGDDEFKLFGTLTMRGVSKNIVLNVEYGGLVQDPWGNTRAGFTVTGKINRQDFGVSFGGITETGNVMLSDEVKIGASVQFVKQTVTEQVPA